MDAFEYGSRRRRSSTADDQEETCIAGILLEQERRQQQEEQQPLSARVKFSPFIAIMGQKTNEELYGSDDGSMSLLGGASSHTTDSNSLASFGTHTTSSSTGSSSTPVSKLQGSWNLYRAKKKKAQQQQQQQQQKQDRFLGFLRSNSSSSSNSNDEGSHQQLLLKKELSMTEKGFGSFGDLANWDAGSTGSSAGSGKNAAWKTQAQDEPQQQQQDIKKQPAVVAPEVVTQLEQSFSVFSLLGMGLAHSTSLTPNTAASSTPSSPASSTPASALPSVTHASFRQNSMSNSRLSNLNEQTASTGDASGGEVFEDEFEDVEMEDAGRSKNEKFVDRAVKKQDDMYEGTDEDSVVSASEQSEGASTIDEAERMEQQVRKTLLFACLSALGIVFLGTLISRLIGKCFRGSSDSGEIAADLAGGTARDAAGAPLMPGAGSEHFLAATNIAGQAQ